jgi:hypothetical protein
MPVSDDSILDTPERSVPTSAFDVFDYGALTENATIQPNEIPTSGFGMHSLYDQIKSRYEKMQSVLQDMSEETQDLEEVLVDDAAELGNMLDKWAAGHRWGRSDPPDRTTQLQAGVLVEALQLVSYFTKSSVAAD